MKDKDLRHELARQGYLDRDSALGDFSDIHIAPHPEKEIYFHPQGWTEGLEATIKLLFERQDALAEAMGYEFIAEEARPPRIIARRRKANRG